MHSKIAASHPYFHPYNWVVRNRLSGRAGNRVQFSGTEVGLTDGRGGPTRSSKGPPRSSAWSSLAPSPACASRDFGVGARRGSEGPIFLLIATAAKSSRRGYVAGATIGCVGRPRLHGPRADGRPTQVSKTVRGTNRDAKRVAAQLESQANSTAPASETSQTSPDGH